MKRLRTYIKALHKMDMTYVVFGLMSVGIFVFYLFFINFSSDTIILFLSNKLFFGRWLVRGVFAWFNPSIYLGIPVAFDLALGNFHPFSLFFLLPYPVSFAVWMGAVSLVFLTGFYAFFKTYTKTHLFAFILTLILFFSGSGYMRSNNPTIFIVIAHFGWFCYFLTSLKRKGISLPFILTGVLMALAGHIQFVLYGYMLALLIGLVILRLPWRKVLLHFLIIGIGISWYLALSIPLFLRSTRITTDVSYLTTGRLLIPHLFIFLFPLFFGYLQNGSFWNVGPTTVPIVSLLFSFFLIAISTQTVFRKVWCDIVILGTFLISAFGVFNFPLFRDPSQVIVLFHIWGLLYIARYETSIISIVRALPLRIIGIVGSACSFLLFLFLYTSAFSSVFIRVYTILKHRPPNLFFDAATIHAIGQVIGLNFVIYIVLFLLLFAISFLHNKQGKKYVVYVLCIFVLFEGLFVNYFHSYFIRQSILTKKYPLPGPLQTNLYRVQTGADVIPYFGFHMYMSSVLFRPPFSKEPPLITPKEEKDRTYLQYLMSFYPSTWGMTYGLQAVQGYNTFVPQTLANYFKKPSDDYEQVYGAIIKRNNLFGNSEKGLAINGIETSRITLTDPRWEALGVRYFISDRPLTKYKLLEQKNGKYIYEDEWALPLYRLSDGDTLTTKRPVYTDPNGWKFMITPDEVGEELQISINPGGFVAKLNGKEIPVTKDTFVLHIPLHATGTLTVTYSPIRHLQETIRTQLQLFK